MSVMVGTVRRVLHQAVQLVLLVVMLAATLVLTMACGDGEDTIVVSDTATESQWATDHLERVNLHRYANLSGGLLWSEELAQVAFGHAQDMHQRQYFSHQSPDGENVANRVSESAYIVGVVGENIARGNESMAVVIDAWMQSDNHRRNMLFDDYRHLGAARWWGVLGAGLCCPGWQRRCHYHSNYSSRQRISKRPRPWLFFRLGRAVFRLLRLQVCYGV